jgi:hypothetical protein
MYGEVHMNALAHAVHDVVVERESLEAASRGLELEERRAVVGMRSMLLHTAEEIRRALAVDPDQAEWV